METQEGVPCVHEYALREAGKIEKEAACKGQEPIGTTSGTIYDVVA